MTRIVLLTLSALALLACGIGGAQDLDDFKKMTPEESADLMTGWMKSALALEESQVSRVHEINLKYAKKNRELANSGDRKIQLYRKLKSSSREKDNELKKIFTDEQYRIYTKKKDEMKDKIKQRMQDRKK